VKAASDAPARGGAQQEPRTQPGGQGGLPDVDADPPGPWTPGRQVAAVLLLLAAGTVVRFLALGQQSFWYDEIHSVTSAWGEPHGRLAEAFFNPHGPLYLLLLRGWMRLFGHAEAPVRLLSALLGSVGLVLFYRMTRRLAGRTAGIVALALLACSPYFLWYSQEARNYVLLFDLGLLAVPAFLSEIERRTRASFLVALLTIAATCLANLSGFFLLVLDAIYVLTVGRRLRYPPRRFLLLALLSVVLLSPWIIRGAATTGQLHLNVPGAGGTLPAPKGESPAGLLSIPFTFYDFSVGLSLGPSTDELKLHRIAAVIPHLWYLIPLAALFALTAWYGFRRATASVRSLLLPWLALPILLMAGLSVLSLKAPNSRYAFLSFAPYLTLLAIGVSSIRGRTLQAAVLAGIVLCSAYSDYRYFTEPRYWRPDARAAGRLLTREAEPGDAVVVYVLDDPVRYYVPDSMSFMIPDRQAFRDEGAMNAWLGANTGGRKRVWIVQCQSWWIDREDRFLRVCRSTMTLQRRWPFAKLPVYLFVRSGSQGAPTSR
jgi:4-amino-4-deoxy-L-arabinose transferase-like glycosyltransferase